MEMMEKLYWINALGGVGLSLGLLIYTTLFSRLSVAVRIPILALFLIGCAIWLTIGACKRSETIFAKSNYDSTKKQKPSNIKHDQFNQRDS